MKNINTRGIIVFSLLLCMPAITVHAQTHYKQLVYPALGEIVMPEATTITLNNGMKVILVEDHELPFISMRAEFFAGSCWADPDDKVGLSRLTGQVMRTGGSVNKSGDEIDEELEAIAASVETWIDEVYGGASLSTLKDHFDQVSGILADILLNPAFPEEKIELAKVEARSEISRRNDDVNDVAEREFDQLIYKNSKLARDEEYTTINAIIRDDLIACHKKWVRPNGMALAVWGDFKTKNMIKKIESLFKNWKPVEIPDVAKSIEVPYDYEYKVNLIPKTDVNQSNIYVGHIGGTKNMENYAALVMMNEVLSGGFSSRLFSRVRSDQGLSYAVYGGYGTQYFHPGVFYVHSKTQSGRTIEAVRSLMTEIRNMVEEPVTDEELKVAKEGWLNSYVFNFDSIDKTARRLARLAYNNYPADFLQQIRKQVESVTAEDITAVAGELLKPDKVQILVVGNPAEFEEPLSVLGEVNEIDISIPQPTEKVPEASDEAVEKGKALVMNMAEKMGGFKKINDIRSLETKFQMVQVSPMGEMQMEGSSTMVFPDKVHMNLSTPMGEMQMTMAGENAWMTVPQQGTMPAPAPVKEQLKDMIIRDLAYVIKNLDIHDIQFVGETTVKENPAFELLISRGDSHFYLYLDKETLLPLSEKYMAVTQQGPMEIITYISDYRDVGGIQTAHKTESYSGEEKVASVTLSEVILNGDVDMSLFEKAE